MHHHRGTNSRLCWQSLVGCQPDHNHHQLLRGRPCLHRGLCCPRRCTAVSFSSCCSCSSACCSSCSSSSCAFVVAPPPPSCTSTSCIIASSATTTNTTTCTTSGSGSQPVCLAISTTST